MDEIIQNFSTPLQYGVVYFLRKSELNVRDIVANELKENIIVVNNSNLTLEFMQQMQQFPMITVSTVSLTLLPQSMFDYIVKMLNGIHKSLIDSVLRHIVILNVKENEYNSNKDYIIESIEKNKIDDKTIVIFLVG